MDVTVDVTGMLRRMYAWMSYGCRTDVVRISGYRTGIVHYLVRAMEVTCRSACAELLGLPGVYKIRPSRWPYTRPTPPVAKTVARAQVPAVKYHRVDVGLPWGTVGMSCGYRTDKFWMYGGCTADDRTDDVGVS